ncbi:MAG: isopentenyl phosphate kinase [Thermoanaerobaculia bacterium]
MSPGRSAPAGEAETPGAERSVEPVVLVKLGGSLITDKQSTAGGSAGVARSDVIRRLAAELAAALRQAAPSRVVLGHGSGSFGHAEAARQGVHRGLASHPEETGADPAETARRLQGVSRVQERAATLHHRVVAALLEAGLAPFSVAPSSALVTSGGRPEGFAVEPLALALGSGLLPVVYGDVVVDREQGCAIASTETVLLAAAGELLRRGTPVRNALWAGTTDGVLDAAGRTIPEVRADGADDALAAAGASAGTDVTGGMRHRLEAALALARLGVPSTIFDATVPGRLGAALRGEAVGGTRVAGG